MTVVESIGIALILASCALWVMIRAIQRTFRIRPPYDMWHGDEDEE